MKDICDDLEAEYQALDSVLETLSEVDWRKSAQFHDWSLYDEVAHICYFDHCALLAMRSPELLAAEVEPVLRLLQVGSMPDYVNERLGLFSGEGLLSRWRTVRGEMLNALRACGRKDRLPWFGPPMSALSFATARLMETWTHGQDIFDACGVRRLNTDRLRHIAHLGVNTFGWTYANRGLDVPRVAMRIELIAPSETIWTWGPEIAEERVTGTAEDFCLVVAQRRNLADSALQVHGKTATEWLNMAQCFAGPPATPPSAGRGRFN